MNYLILFNWEDLSWISRSYLFELALGTTFDIKSSAVAPPAALPPHQTRTRSGNIRAPVEVAVQLRVLGEISAKPCQGFLAGRSGKRCTPEIVQFAQMGQSFHVIHGGLAGLDRQAMISADNPTVLLIITAPKACTRRFGKCRSCTYTRRSPIPICCGSLRICPE